MLGVLVVVAFVLMAPKDAAWKADPADAVYDNPANWTSGSVPNGTAVFGASAQSDITFTRKRINHYRYPNGFSWDLEGWISAASWRFDQGAGRYNFTIGAASYPIDPTPRVPCTGERLRFTGAGIAIRAGHVSITNDSCLAFVSKSTAGSVSISNNKWLDFWDGADAGSASILNDNALRFHDSNARNAVITNNAELAFRGNSSADDATILNNGRVWIIENSTGGNAAIDNATSSASVIFDRARPSLGSIAGAGKIYLDKAQLSIGGNNQSTTFSGVISDSESHNDTEASLIKVGSGTLTLSGTNSYRGPTSVIGGVLVVDGSIATSRLTRVERGGRVAGTGAIGSTQIVGGVLRPARRNGPEF
ncbi:MAG: autotransporter-associated beta strand repeat-containing protein [Alphaproteobacteria bacterium]|nr:autotransporter-associated beta strand repeat-containing protein [Alphaproteobacteria bacterium]